MVELRSKMSMKSGCLAFCLLLIILVFGPASADVEKDGDLLVGTQVDEAQDSMATINDKDGLDGGFSSMEGMLHWAIGHSDPAKLKEAAENVQHLSPDELKTRQTQIKELMERSKTLSDTELMKIAIDDLKNASLPLKDHLRALQELLTLVEHIDNSNDLKKLGGLTVVVRKLKDTDLEIRTAAAWILGKAGQNNPVVQKQVLDLGALPKLMKMAKSDSVEEAGKALFAVAALIRNNKLGNKKFYLESGEIMLQDILSNSNTDIRLSRKAVSLLGDLAEFELATKDHPELPFFSDHDYLKAVVDLTASSDLDLQEKTLITLKNLLKLKTTEGWVFKDCGLDKALEKMQQQLLHLMEEEDQRDYATDVESLRKDVECLFHKKLKKKKKKTFVD